MRVFIFSPRFNWFDIVWTSTCFAIFKESPLTALALLIAGSIFSGMMERKAA